MTNRISEADVVVLGGGLTGLVFAGLLGQACKQSRVSLRITLLETSPPTNDDTMDLRVSAITQASVAILQSLGIWEQIPTERLSPFRRMRVWQAAGKAGQARAISFDAAELAEAQLGYIIENKVMRRAAWNMLESLDNVVLLTQTSPVQLTEHPDYCALGFADDSVLQARLLIGADGTNSWVRQQLAVPFHARTHHQKAIVALIATEKPHAETAWQRFLTTGPVALLPLADGNSSLVWSCPDAQADELLQLDTEEFAQTLTDALDHELGSLRCLSSRVSFPLASGYATDYTGRRFALLGDAAHRIHPLAGQGANLGLLDAAVLAEALAAHLQLPLADPGDPLVLRRYERARKGDNLLTMATLDTINRVFSGPLAGMAGRGLAAVDRSVLLKRWLAHYATGSGRDLPAAARPRLT